MIVFPDSLTYVNKKAVFAHNFTKTFASNQKSSYLCTVKRHKGYLSLSRLTGKRRKPKGLRTG